MQIPILTVVENERISRRIESVSFAKKSSF